MATLRKLPVTIGTLMIKLKEFAPEYEVMTDSALRGKICRFMDRHNLVLRRVNVIRPFLKINFSL